MTGNYLREWRLSQKEEQMQKSWQLWRKLPRSKHVLYHTISVDQEFGGSIVTGFWPESSMASRSAPKTVLSQDSSLAAVLLLSRRLSFPHGPVPRLLEHPHDTMPTSPTRSSSREWARWKP